MKGRCSPFAVAIRHSRIALNFLIYCRPKPLYCHPEPFLLSSRAAEGSAVRRQQKVVFSGDH